LYALACRLAGQGADAEDVVQEAMMAAFRAVGSFRHQSSLKTWLTRILIRKAAEHFRRRRRKRWLFFRPPERLEDETAGPDPGVRLDVRAAVLALRPEFREVLVMREFEGFSYDEMARELHVPRGTIESRLFRARQELRVRLSDYLE
jgi:RNA polymerase sigma-70 factor (ECF subfamily)